MADAATPYCHYHPLVPAAWRCDACERNACDACINDGPGSQGVFRCLLCNAPLLSLGSGHGALPFWRRIQDSFRYPLNGNAAALILGTALLTTGATYLPGLIALIAVTMSAGALVRYAFTCLQSTAQGRLVPPDITSSYEGGVRLLFQLFALIVIVIVGLGFAAGMLGPWLAGALAVMVVTMFPAVIIVFAVTDSMLTALNPTRAFGLIRAVGMPYVLILCFILIMFASVGVLQEALSGVSVISAFMQAAVSNYYVVVMFHIMGYMVFQYQNDLGYTAHVDHGEVRLPREDVQVQQARLDVFVKEGRYAQARELLAEMVKANPEDRALGRQCLEFLIATGDVAGLQGYASIHFERALARRDPDPLVPDYHRICALAPDYMPDTPEVRVAIAQALFDRGEFKAAVKLLANLHKAFPNYAQVSVAYELMARALDELPDMAAQAEQYREFAARVADDEAFDMKGGASDDG